MSAPELEYVAGDQAGVHLSVTSDPPEIFLRRPRDNGDVTPPRPAPGTIPESPGSYQFKDRDGRVIYVGKAKSLRSRLNSYFQDPKNMDVRKAQMVEMAESVEWMQVRNDVEALMLEYSLIKQHRPRFNIRLRDDKSYPFLAVTLSDEWPRAMVRRGQKDKGTRYYGPYGHAYAIRETLDLLLRTFPIRTCSDHKFERHEKQGRPCLLFHIEKCAGPCVGEIDKPSYDRLVQDLCQFLDGDTGPIVGRLQQDMQEAAAGLEFERAARLRDRLATVRKAIEKQSMVTERPEDLDVLGISEDELESAVQVFYVRRGRVVGRKGFVVDKVEELTSPQLMARILESMYTEPTLDVPREVLVPWEPEDVGFYEEWMSMLRGTRVSIRVPQRGDKRALQEMVTQNAKEEFVRHRLKRSADHNSRARALNALQDALDLPEAPLRIECYDMSHIQGSDYVGSMVVLEDGLPNKREYRRFKVRSVAGNDDFAAMEEVLTRRLTALLAERDKPVGQRPGKFHYPPQLLLVDGGKGQLSVAVRVLEELGLDDEIPVASLAKQFEEVYLPGRGDPVRIPRQSEALYLLQRIRDEAHRFAITYHRQLRGARMTRSVVDDVPGLGPARKKRLLKELGGVGAVKAAPLSSLVALPWLPDAVAVALYEKIHGAGSAVAVGDDTKVQVD
jgi:excinuclease ABC subunit C